VYDTTVNIYNNTIITNENNYNNIVNINNEHNIIINNVFISNVVNIKNKCIIKKCCCIPESDTNILIIIGMLSILIFIIANKWKSLKN
jgi:hypothetical protein